MSFGDTYTPIYIKPKPSQYPKTFIFRKTIYFKANDSKFGVYVSKMNLSKSNINLGILSRHNKGC